MNIKKLIEFRKELHQYPELSNREEGTAQKIIEKLEEYKPAKIIEGIGGYGVAAIYDSGRPGKNILFRAELDALPINESNKFSHKSKKDGIAHKCGHDGHMTILIGLAQILQKQIKNLKGKIILLFQPAEETAEGALRILAEKKFRNLKSDFIFALHNLPGFPLNSVILRKGVFASASKGLIIDLKGETSHAGFPENGYNPDLALSFIISGLLAIPQKFTNFNSANLITIIKAELGERAFGTSAGKARIMATLRSHSKADMQILTRQSEKLVESIANLYNLKHKLEWVEEFAPIINHAECVDLIKMISKKLKLKIVEPQKPFPWSEDFSFYTKEFPCTFFGLGSGEKYSQLHNSNYDFPDDIIETGIKLFLEIAKNNQQINSLC